MSHNIKDNRVIIVGSGEIAAEYAKILKIKNLGFDVIGRGVQSAQLFETKIGVKPTLGFENYTNLENLSSSPIIIAVDIDQLASVTTLLINKGAKKILVEKPAGMDFNEIEKLNQVAKKNNCNVFVAYNRRFYS